MIAHEHIQRINLKEIACIAIISFFISLLQLFNKAFLDPTPTFIVSLILLVLGMNFAVYLIKKSGVATIFYFITAVFTMSLPDIGIMGWKKIAVFLIAGILFGGPFLILKMRIHSLPVDVITGTVISITSIPIVTAFLLSAGLARSFPVALINLVLVAAVAGLAASILSFLMWYHLEKTKAIIKLELYLINLGK